MSGEGEILRASGHVTPREAASSVRHQTEWLGVLARRGAAPVRRRDRSGSAYSARPYRRRPCPAAILYCRKRPLRKSSRCPSAPAPRSGNRKASWRRPGPCSRASVATCEPTVQASGWRVQNWRRSPTVADAAEIASVAPTSLAGICCDDPVGNRISTMPSQNAMRKRKNMTPTSPATDLSHVG